MISMRPLSATVKVLFVAMTISVTGCSATADNIEQTGAHEPEKVNMYQAENMRQMQYRLVASGANAPTAGEREALIRLIKEMRVLYPIIDEAAAASRPDQRIPFQFDLLKQDFNRVQQGIQQYIYQRAVEPRDFTEIRGEYR